ncbi:acetolactate decarboxylase [Lacticaseibacillus jixianensis]|uniref:Alpha-acetolactate decarboxylase n=1 Tax=Lacticaseibacillus jixianensis TaxID=2486012 RepID=A0ABW4BB66_9LACO|nr:acetolactate decarboxylase [Lacticaseibacillus jixianensis]
MNPNLLYQHGTLGALVPGLLNGTQPLGELLAHGNFGIGTLTGLDGELIILAGVVYQVQASGQVRVIETGAVPFANVHWAAFQAARPVAAPDAPAAEAAILKQVGSRNLFAAIRWHGRFAQVVTRAVKKQTRPYPGLAQTAADQAVFTRDGAVGTLMGYWSPQLYAGMASPGFHLHFLSDDHNFGGHVLSFAGVAGELAVQRFSDVQLHLPASDSEFLAADLDGDLLGDITKAEH